MVNENGEFIQEANIKTKVNVSVIFKSEVDIENCIVGFVLETVKGIWLINCNSAICGKRSSFSVKAGETVKAVFEFIMPAFLQGEYVLGAAVSDGTIENFKVLTWLYNVLCLQVINHGNNSAMIDIDSNIKLYSAEE